MLQETEQAAFERKRREWEEQAEAKTAKNRAKRQKKKERARSGKGEEQDGGPRGEMSSAGPSEVPLKKRRLVNGQELVFRRPGEESDEDEGEVGPMLSATGGEEESADQSTAVPVVEAQRIIIHEED